jgi:hypothetical protein
MLWWYNRYGHKVNKSVFRQDIIFYFYLQRRKKWLYIFQRYIMTQHSAIIHYNSSNNVSVASARQIRRVIKLLVFPCRKLEIA